MANDPTQAPSQQYGPFTEALTGPLTPRQQAVPQFSYAPSKAGGLVSFATSFLTGLQQGKRVAYERSEKQKAEHQNAFNSLHEQIMNDPNVPKEYKDQARQLWSDTTVPQLKTGLSDLEKANKKDGKPESPIVHLAKGIISGVAGPSQNKSHKDYVEPLANMAALARQAFDPKNRIDPNAIGNQAAQGLTSAISDIENRPGVPNANAGQPAAAQVPGLSLPPAPELRQEATAGNVSQNPQAQAALKPLTDQGIDPRTAPQTAEILRTLPQTPKAQAIKTVPVIIQGQQNPDGTPKIASAYQDANGLYRDPETRQVMPGAVLYNAQVKGTVAPPISATAQHRAQAEKDIQELHPDWQPEQVKTEAARQAQLVEASKVKAKTTPEDLLASNYFDSGKATTRDEAKKLAATDLLAINNAKVAAAKENSNGTGSLTDTEVKNLAHIAHLTGQIPPFGLGHSADRVRFLKAFADPTNAGVMTIGEAINNRSSIKALGESKNALRKTSDQIVGYEKSAEGSIAKALEVSKSVDRDSSKLLNGWAQWLSTGTVDDEKLRNFLDLTETAANEYARVISGASNGGVSTVDARKQANQMISAAFGEGAFEGAANAMKTDMLIRTNALQSQLLAIDEETKRIGNSSATPDGTKPTTPPPVDKPQQFTQQNPYTSASGKKVWIGMTGKDKQGNPITITGIDPATGNLTTAPVKK